MRINFTIRVLEEGEILLVENVLHEVVKVDGNRCMTVNLDTGSVTPFSKYDLLKCKPKNK